MLLQLFKEEILLADDSSEPVEINNRFQSRKGFIEVVHESVFRRYPFALLEMFLLLEQNPKLKALGFVILRDRPDLNWQPSA